MVDIFELNVQFDQFIFLKDKDITRMNEYIKKLSDSIMDMSKTELRYNEKIREMARLKHDYSILQNRNEMLEK